ncbi:MAG: class I SAM-dependent methyltransferase [Saprospiraceae bacterium]
MKEYIKGIWAAVKNNSVALKYPWHPKSRKNSEKPVFDVLLPQINGQVNAYNDLIHDICTHVDRFVNIPGKIKPGETGVYWDNDYLPGLDIITIYTLIQKFKPAKIIEIGSGHSTAVIRKTIIEHKLRTHLTCIDPKPRRDIVRLADIHIAKSLETLDDFNIFFNLHPGDIIFLDGSHISLANSDVTVFFMEVLPFVPAGVYIHVHDIYLPYDYPEDMAIRGYNEQYLLAQALLYSKDKFEIIFPCFWISKQGSLQSLLDKNFWSKMNYDSIKTHGGSFWFKIIS